MPEPGERLPFLPIQVRGENCEEYYSSLEEALGPHVHEHPRYHMISFPLEGKIDGSLVRENGREYLELKMGDRIGRTPRSGGNKPGITVSTDYESFMDMCIKTGSYEDPIFDRGIVWVHLMNAGPVTPISVGLNASPTAPSAELSRIVQAREMQAYAVINQILDGTFQSSTAPTE